MISTFMQLRQHDERMIASQAPLTIAIVVASLGRSQRLGELLDELALQSCPPQCVVLAVTDRADLPDNVARHRNVEVVLAPKGSCVQRNRALDLAQHRHDIVFFCDDDYVPSRFAIERITRLFAAHPDIAGATGHLLADGVNGPGIASGEARAMLADYDRRVAAPAVPFRDLDGLYGCNMAFRTDRIGDIRFDERLRLYGWQEDIDFSARVQPQGRIVKTFAFAGVHCGLKAGRSSGVRLGYSQVVNPWYLVQKGTMRWRFAINITTRNVWANHIRAWSAEPWVDRIGRVRGNWIGLFDVLRLRLTPERVETL